MGEKRKYRHGFRKTYYWIFAVEEIINQGNDPLNRYLVTFFVKISLSTLKKDIKQICQPQAKLGLLNKLTINRPEDKHLSGKSC